MSEADEAFELLISTEDYLRLQAKCSELESLQQKQKRENRDLSTKIYDLKEQNQELNKKISILNSEMASLRSDVNEKDERISNHGLELEYLKNLLGVEEKKTTKLDEAYKAHVRQMESQINSLSKQKKQLEKKISQLSSLSDKSEKQTKQLKTQIEKLDKKNQQLICELKKSRQETEKASCDLKMIADQKEKIKLELQNQIHKLKEFLKSKEDGEEVVKGQQTLIQCLKQEVSKTREETARVSHELQQQIQSNLDAKRNYEKKVSELHKKLEQECRGREEKQKMIDELNQKVSMLSSDLEITSRRWEDLMLETEKQRYNFVERTENLNKLQQQKQANFKNQIEQIVRDCEQKITVKNVMVFELQQQIIQLNSGKQSFQQNLKAKLKDTESALEKQKEAYANLQKEYEEIILAMQEEKKQSRVGKETQKDQLKTVKSLLEEYFTNLALNLYEIGNLDTSDIKGILAQQQEIVKQYISDIISAFVFKSKKPGVHRYPACN